MTVKNKDNRYQMEFNCIDQLVPKNHLVRKIDVNIAYRWFIDMSEIFIDSTHIKASANKKKYNKKEVEIEAKKYQQQLEKEINEDRENHNKKPLKKTKKATETKVISESTTDKESGMFFKNEKEEPGAIYQIALIYLVL